MSIGDIPDPGERGVPRYSRRALPPYRYVPGVHPHPVRDPRGHSYQSVQRRVHHAPWHPESWMELDDWLAGVDLFNRFYFWEAHEAWEALWATAPRHSPAALMLQGLIQEAAALLKTHMRVLGGAKTLSSEGLRKLQHATVAGTVLMGLDVRQAASSFARYFRPLDRDAFPSIGPSVPKLRLGRES